MRQWNEKTVAKLVGVNDGRAIATGQDDPARVGAGGRIYAIFEGADGQRYGKRFSIPLSPADVESADAFKKAFQRSDYSGMYDLDESSLAGQNLPWHTGRGEGNKGRTTKPYSNADWQESTFSGVDPELLRLCRQESQQASFSASKDAMPEAERVELLSLTPLGRATLAFEAERGR